MKIDGIEYKEPKTGAWDKYSLYQFTSRGIANGIQGNVDLNFTPLSLPELTGITPPSPNSNPTEPSAVVFTKFSQNDPKWKEVKMGE